MEFLVVPQVELWVELGLEAKWARIVTRFCCQPHRMDSAKRTHDRQQWSHLCTSGFWTISYAVICWRMVKTARIFHHIWILYYFPLWRVHKFDSFWEFSPEEQWRLRILALTTTMWLCICILILVPVWKRLRWDLYVRWLILQDVRWGWKVNSSNSGIQNQEKIYKFFTCWNREKGEILTQSTSPRLGEFHFAPFATQHK